MSIRGLYDWLLDGMTYIIMLVYSIGKFKDDDIAFISILTNHYGVDSTRLMKRKETIKPYDVNCMWSSVWFALINKPYCEF